MHEATTAMHGGLVFACLAGALFFLRFWRESGDRFHLFFAAALVLFGANWVGVLSIEASAESRHLVYLVRLLAFTLILVAIIDKNRRRD